MSEKVNLNQKIKNLDKEVEWFYSDEFELDKAAVKYKDLTVLAKDIEKDLAELKNEIKVIDEDFSK